MNAGLRQLAPGIQLTIRNVATHDQTELSPPDALERITTLSLLAKWAEQCELIEAEPEEPSQLN